MCQKRISGAGFCPKNLALHDLGGLQPQLPGSYAYVGNQVPVGLREGFHQLNGVA